jgi:hypothetical protein
VAVRLVRSDSVVLDSTVAVPESGRFTTPGLIGGRYVWSTRSEDGVESSGGVDVESWSAELLHARVADLERSRERPERGDEGAGPGRRLRTHPVPYLLVLALLSTEWILRRRKGLR